MSPFTLSPEDFPLGEYAQLEHSLGDQAGIQVDLARQALKAGDPHGAIARYEAALARLLFARQLADVNRTVVSQVSQRHHDRLAVAAIELDPNADVDEPGYLHGYDGRS